MKTLTKEQALSKAAAYCAKAEHCTQEVWDKLRLWGMSEAESNHIIAQLQKEKYINHERFCHSFVRDKFRFSKWGRIKIAYALRAKGLESTLVQEALDDIDEQEYLEVLRQIVQVKRKSIRTQNPRELQFKLMRFVASRGFEGELLKKIHPMEED